MKLGKIACFLSALTVAFSFASCEGSGDDPVAKVELSTTISQIPEGIISLIRRTASSRLTSPES